MIKKLSVAFLSIVAVQTAALAQTFMGNGASGFTGAVGNGTLQVTATATGFNFVFNAGAALGANDDVVFYIDSVAGGFSDTSQFSDNADGGREATSGFNAGNPSRALVTSRRASPQTTLLQLGLVSGWFFSWLPAAITH